jgi:flagellar assembly protein FliH
MAPAKQSIRRQITLAPGQIVAVIKEALLALPYNSKKIKVYLHPSDAQIAREHLSPPSNYSESDDERWSVIDEPNITRGGCQIKSEFSQIDASIDTRIAEISARLLGSERTDSESSGNEIVSETEPKDESDSLMESSFVEVQKDG